MYERVCYHKSMRNMSKVKRWTVSCDSRSSIIHIQQFIINTQPPPPSSSKKKDIALRPILRSSLPPAIQYVPVSAAETSLTRIVEREPFAYQHVYSPTFVQRRPVDFYNSYESPVRRVVRARPSNTRNVHLPRHAKRLVNRFLSEMEYAHGRRVRERLPRCHFFQFFNFCWTCVVWRR